MYCFIDLLSLKGIPSAFAQGPAQAQNLRDSLSEVKSDIVVKVIPSNHWHPSDIGLYNMECFSIFSLNRIAYIAADCRLV